MVYSYEKMYPIISRKHYKMVFHSNTFVSMFYVFVAHDMHFFFRQDDMNLRSLSFIQVKRTHKLYQNLIWIKKQIICTCDLSLYIAFQINWPI
jgi:hypothetical protein